MNGILDNVKVGDKLLVRDRMCESVDTVTRLTATLVVTKCGRRYKKNNGGLYGGSEWSYEYAEPLTPEIERRIAIEARHKMLVRKYREIRIDSLTDSQLEAILKIANKEEGGTNGED